MSDKFGVLEYNDVNNNINVQHWFEELALKEPLAFIAMIGIDDNTSKFKNVFGDLKSEHINGKDVWYINEQGCQFAILVDKHKTLYAIKYAGTAEEFVYDKKISSSILIFLGKILNKLAN